MVFEEIPVDNRAIYKHISFKLVLTNANIYEY